MAFFNAVYLIFYSNKVNFLLYGFKVIKNIVYLK